MCYYVSIHPQSRFLLLLLFLLLSMRCHSSLFFIPHTHTRQQPKQIWDLALDERRRKKETRGKKESVPLFLCFRFFLCLFLLVFLFRDKDRKEEEREKTGKEEVV